jgi:hypothetical protein
MNELEFAVRSIDAEEVKRLCSKNKYERRALAEAMAHALRDLDADILETLGKYIEFPKVEKTHNVVGSSILAMFIFDAPNREKIVLDEFNMFKIAQLEKIIEETTRLRRRQKLTEMG